MASTTTANDTSEIEMHQPHEKEGTTVTPTEPNAKPASTPKSGFFAALCSTLRIKGTGARLRGPRGRRLLPVVVAALAVVVALTVVTSLALASSSPPEFSSELKEEAVYATRAYLVEDLGKGGLEVKWHAEYATNPSGPWTAAASETFGPSGGGVQEVSLGTDPPAKFFHHLVPDTPYYARFQAENSAKEAAVSKTFTFKTTAVTEPEIAENPHTKATSFKIEATGPRSAVAEAQIESNGAETKYAFEYAPAEANGQSPAEGSSAWVAFEPAGTVTVAEDLATPKVKTTSLAPETKYYARVKATNEKGTVTGFPVEGSVGENSFTTPTARPEVFVPEFRNVTGTSAHFEATLGPHGLETEWRFEYAESEGGPWTVVAGAEGTVSQAQAEALPGARLEGSLTGLSPSTTYYVRLFAKSAAGEGRNAFGEPIVGEKRGFGSFETFGAPTSMTFAVHGLDGEALRVIGAVNPDSVPTSGEQTITVGGAPTGGTFTLTFEGQTTAPIAFNAPSGGEAGETKGSVKDALEALSTIAGQVYVTGPAGGPYTVYFGLEKSPLREKAEPQIVADASGLTPLGGAPAPTVTVSIVFAGGEGYDTHYHFEYVSQKQFEAPGGEGGFARAGSTPEVDLGSGDGTVYIGADLPALTPGETYRFRAVATNTSPGDPVVDGEEQVLTVSAAVAGSEGGGGCPNEVLRTGPSALLPDCRAFEQLTPVDKEGAQEIFNYGSSVGFEGAFPSEDGDHFVYASHTVKWGAGARAGQGPYFFSRGADGWQSTAATAQPEAGIAGSEPDVFGPDLSELAFQARWETSPSSPSPKVEYKAGPPGGPYVTVASVPRADTTPYDGWVGGSGDFSKLVLEVADRTLAGHSTHTHEGNDLYEYSKGELRQANVTGPAPGSTIGTCGASIANGPKFAETVLFSAKTTEGHPVSADGSLVFFEAVPTGESCSEATHLYVRVDGGEEDAETIDIGAYKFIAATPDGSKVLLEKPSGQNPGLYLYKAGAVSSEFLHSSGVATENSVQVGSNLTVSEDLSTVYIHVGGSSQGLAASLYRYDVPDETLSLITQISAGDSQFFSSSPEGRYFYFIAETVAGLPGGGIEHEASFGDERPASQVYRYDSAEDLVQCMSCASSFDPAPKLSALFTAEGGKTVASANGDYVFFDTPAALVPSDVDGEVAPESVRGIGGEHQSDQYTLSSDVYEWRRDGVNRCAHVQGCLALITSGHGGFLNILLGTTSSGNDVFFSTNESLVASDNDTAGDIYDARVDGGFAEPLRPVECKGDSCSTPFAPPNDLTPSSASFQGAGNLVTEVTSPSAAKKKPASKKKKAKKKLKKKAVKRKRNVKKSNRRGK
jgi:hypothetical protein